LSEVIHKEIILPAMDKEEGVTESSAGIDRVILTNDAIACTPPSLESFSNDPHRTTSNE